MNIIRPWRKSQSSNPNGACVECASFCTCTEVKTGAHGVAVRDSADQSGPVLYFDLPVFAAFTAKIRNS